MPRAVLEIDGTAFSTLEEFWDEVSRKLVPGETWGRNLDAFNDILRGGFGTPEGGFVLIWRSSHASRQRLGYPETVRQLKLKRQVCHPSHYATLEDELGAAHRSTGPTVFGWLVDIISAHREIELRLE